MDALGVIFVLGFTVAMFFIMGFCEQLLLDRKARKEDERKALEVAEERRYYAAIQTLDDAYSLSPTEFETLVGRLFEKQGYSVGTTATTSDGGVDLVLTKNGATELVQCKKYKNSVPVNAIREFYGVMVSRRCTRGYFVTTGHFTASGINFAQGKGLHLIDGPELAEMLIDHQV